MSSTTSSTMTRCWAAAADADLASHLDRWILQQMLLSWGEPGCPSRAAHLLVRLSDESVKDPSLVLTLGRALRKMGIDGTRLVFEISELAATGYVRYARGFVRALKRLGCMAALARFGAGSNSFRTLKPLGRGFPQNRGERDEGAARQSGQSECDSLHPGDRSSHQQGHHRHQSRRREQPGPAVGKWE